MFAALSACSGDPALPLPDTGPSPDAAPPSAEPEVAAPDLPVLTPCPEGWRAVDGEPVTCDAWPETGREECGPGEAHFPGTAGCAPVGAPCPEGEFPSDLPDGVPTLFVNDDAPSNGANGTRTAPYPTIGEAMSRARQGTTIAIAKGTYEEGVRMRNGVTLWGACARETRIENRRVAANGSVVLVEEAGAVLRNLSLGGVHRGLVVTGPRGNVEAHGVAVEGAWLGGINLYPGGRLTGDHLVVRDTVVGENIFGYGIALTENSSAVIHHVVVERATSMAVAVLGAELVLEDAALTDSRAQPRNGRLGGGLEAIGGADVTLRRVVIADNRDLGIYLHEPGTRLLVEDSIIGNTASRTLDAGGGNGVWLVEGTSATLRRSLIADSHEVAVLASDADTAISLEDVVIRDTAARGDGWGGSALAVQDGATANATRVLTERNVSTGVSVTDGSVLHLSDLIIRATQSQPSDGKFGTGLQIQGNATVEGARLLIADCAQAGVTAIASMVALTDVEVSDVLERACAASGSCPGLGIGDGIISADDASLTIDGFIVRRSARVGVHVGGGEMDLRNGWVTDNPIGAAVQTPAFDVARISEGVVYVDNARNLDTSALPLPEPLPPSSDQP